MNRDCSLTLESLTRYTNKTWLAARSNCTWKARLNKIRKMCITSVRKIILFTIPRSPAAPGRPGRPGRPGSPRIPRMNIESGRLSHECLWYYHWRLWMNRLFHLSNQVNQDVLRRPKNYSESKYNERLIYHHAQVSQDCPGCLRN